MTGLTQGVNADIEEWPFLSSFSLFFNFCSCSLCPPLEYLCKNRKGE